jgi:hypothetical protein
MRGGILATPRPVPGRLIPLAGGGLVLLLALPVFLIAGWPVSGWALGAFLWGSMQAINFLVSRMQRRASSVAAAGMQGFALFFKAIALLVVLAAIAATDSHDAVAAVLTFALAYTFELGLSLVSYFGSSE